MEWIDVNDRLPDYPSEYVIVCMSSGLVLSTLYCVDKNYFNDSCVQSFIGDTDEISAHFEHAMKYGYRVTHWMRRWIAGITFEITGVAKRSPR